jgi:hypothetical protein
LQKLLEQATFENLGMKKKWKNKKLLQVSNKDIEKIIDKKRETYKKYLLTNTLEDKIAYNHKHSTARCKVGKIRRQTCNEHVSQLETDLY